MFNKQILKTYLLHFTLSILSVILFLWSISYYLDTYTKHNEYINTPNLLHLPINEAIKIIQNKKLRYTIIDSLYNPKEKSGIIIAQNPEPNFKVKEYRNIYITITSFQPPSIQMPKLIDLSERQAIRIIQSYDLKLGKIIYEPSYCNGCVIKQLYANKDIPAGEIIKKGSTIDIVVGKKELIPSTPPVDTINTD